MRVVGSVNISSSKVSTMAEYIAGDELDDLFMAIEEDLFWEDQEFRSDVEQTITELSTVAEFSCQYCDKVCKSARGLTRHTNCKHSELTVETKLNPGFTMENFKTLFRNCVEKVNNDECLPDEVLEELKSVAFTDEDVSSAFAKLKGSIFDFVRSGDGEKFYPTFQRIFTENIGSIFVDTPLSRDYFCV